ncbi:DUF5689 domain-containing protein [Flavobacterium sp.]|uniref:DUF5689 domain-containing protein n=1 Tax=Flavobacterium sp. TaxID=239 RepID=UPI0040482AA9
MKKIILTTAIFATLFSCVNDDDYSAPAEDCTSLIANVTVQSVTTTATSSATEYTNDDIIEAYVTSSDEGGNFYKSISFVSLDGTTGFSMPVDNYNLFTKYEPGRKVFINLKNRFYNTQNNSTVIGSNYGSGVGRISGVEYQNIIIRSCDKVDEDDIINNITITQAQQNQNLNKLIEFDNVQFTDASIDQNYYDTDVFTIGGGTNHQITDEFGNTTTLRVSSFASFASANIPSGSGKIRGVMTKFGSTYQFMIRTLNDVKLDNARMEIDFFPPLVGNALVYGGALNEPFTSYTTSNQQDFPAYINDASVGSRYWQLKTFSGNKYIQMSSFGGGNTEANRGLFIVPVNMTTANTFSFKTKDGYNNGNVLKVYYSTNYVPGNQISTATLVDITSSFTISSGNTSGYGANFISSGTYNIPVSLTGNGYFIFEYVGNGSTGPTTTMQIDDIVIN